MIAIYSFSALKESQLPLNTRKASLFRCFVSTRYNQKYDPLFQLCSSATKEYEKHTFNSCIILLKGTLVFISLAVRPPNLTNMTKITYLRAWIENTMTAELKNAMIPPKNLHEL